MTVSFAAFNVNCSNALTDYYEVNCDNDCLIETGEEYKNPHIHVALPLYQVS